MKKILSLLAVFLFVGVAVAKDIRVAIFKVEQMHCVNCEAKVKRNIPYEKGVKNMKTDIEQKTVTVTFDADVTDVEKLREGFEKFGYRAEVIKVESKGDKPAKR